jgi:isoleucyl-tRNA synthetase
VLDESGKKLSKRLRNYPDPDTVFETIGSDALRWFMVSSPLMKGGDLRIDREGKQIAEVVRLVINPIWNAYSFFCLYANVDGIKARERADSPALLDRYLLAKTHDLVAQLEADLDAYELSAACAGVLRYLDALNNWYIRRSRERFWRAERDADKQDAYDTLYTALVTLCRSVAPLLPMLSEEIYRGLSGEKSVHLSSWPDARVLPEDAALVVQMDRVRDVCSSALALRAAENARVRQPLASLTVAGSDTEALEPYLDLIADEVNVKQVKLTSDITEYATFRLQVNARALGPRLGADTKNVIAASKRGQWSLAADGSVEVAGHSLAEGEYSLLLQARDGVSCEPLPGNDAIVVLDLDLSEELVQEGVARDVVRVVQQARKEAGLHVSDRIRLALLLSPEAAQAVDRFRDYVSEQTLATELELGHAADATPHADKTHPADAPGDELFRHEAQLGGKPVQIALARSSRS